MNEQEQPGALISAIRGHAYQEDAVGAEGGCSWSGGPVARCGAAASLHRHQRHVDHPFAAEPFTPGGLLVRPCAVEVDGVGRCDLPEAEHWPYTTVAMMTKKRGASEPEVTELEVIRSRFTAIATDDGVRWPVATMLQPSTLRTLRAGAGAEHSPSARYHRDEDGVERVTYSGTSFMAVYRIDGSTDALDTPIGRIAPIPMTLESYAEWAPITQEQYERVLRWRRPHHESDVAPATQPQQPESQPSETVERDEIPEPTIGGHDWEPNPANRTDASGFPCGYTLAAESAGYPSTCNEPLVAHVPSHPFTPRPAPDTGFCAHKLDRGLLCPMPAGYHESEAPA